MSDSQWLQIEARRTALMIVDKRVSICLKEWFCQSPTVVTMWVALPMSLVKLVGHIPSKLRSSPHDKDARYVYSSIQGRRRFIPTRFWRNAIVADGRSGQEALS